ncbi:MarR family winged helix-turn-helix transcriptional regulator [Microbacterium sp. GXF7504]
MDDQQPAPPVSAETDDFGRATEQALRSLGAGHDESSMFLGIQVVRAGNAFTQVSEKKVHRPRGLRWAGFTIMFLLMVYRRLETRTVARLTGVTRQAASLVLATLERDGYVLRDAPTEEDRRIVPISLSDAGERVAKEVLQEQLALADDWFSVLSSEERRELSRLLSKLMAQRGLPESQREDSTTVT